MLSHTLTHISGSSNGEIKGLSSLFSHTSFAEAEVLIKKELPGPVQSGDLT